jgi:hypothetical protein
MNVLNFVLGLTAVGLAAVLLRRKVENVKLQRLARTELLFVDVVPMLSDVVSKPGEAEGTWIVTGKYQSAPFQLRSIIDTLATRKLPSLWLQVTLQRAQPVPCIVNAMMRPAGATSFSNFDFLPDTLPHPPDAPLEAVVKSDDGSATHKIMSVMSRHFDLLRRPNAKEILVSPNGLRLVVQAAEAGRLRYGVFRQADFEGATITPEVLLPILNGLLALEAGLRDHATHA